MGIPVLTIATVFSLTSESPYLGKPAFILTHVLVRLYIETDEAARIKFNNPTSIIAWY